MSFCKNTILAVIDTCLCLFVFFPLSVIHWRGTWDLLDAYIIPDDLFYSSWVSFAIGATACFFGYMLQPQLSKWSLGRGRICHGFVVRIYMYLFSWAILCYWRGTWNLMDLYMGEGIPNALLWYGIAIGLSVLFRTSRTIAGIPMQIQVDTDPEFCLEPDTRFKIQPTEIGWFVLDVCFSQFVLVTLSIFAWRGIWNVLDAALYPDNPLLSDVSSLVFGYIIVIVVFLLQYPASLLSSALDKYHISFKILFEDIIMIVATWGVLLIWRGAWDLQHGYFLPDKVVGGWTCHAIGVIGLFLLQGYGNVGTNGIDVDGSYQGGAGIFQTEFLRLIFGTKEHTREHSDDGIEEDKTRLLAEDEDDGTEEELREERDFDDISDIIYEKIELKPMTSTNV